MKTNLANQKRRGISGVKSRNDGEAADRLSLVLSERQLSKSALNVRRLTRFSHSIHPRALRTHILFIDVVGVHQKAIKFDCMLKCAEEYLN